MTDKPDDPRAAEPPAAEPRKRPSEEALRRLDLTIARARKPHDEQAGRERAEKHARPAGGLTPDQRRQYRYLRSKDLREDELAYGDRISTRFLSVTGGADEPIVQVEQATVVRTRSGRIIEEADRKLPKPRAR